MENRILKLVPFIVKKYGGMKSGLYQLIKTDILKLKIVTLL